MAQPKKRSPRVKRNYFTQETEDAILLYNKTESYNERSRIYSKHIHYPFFKLTQNIIHTFKFYHTEVDDLEHLQHEIEVFLLDRLHLYHHSKSINDRLNKIINKEFKEVKLNRKGEEKPLYKMDSFLKYTDNSDCITQDQINTFINKFKVSDECKLKLSKLTPPKAYSYFGTIVKRFLINYCNKNYNKKIDKASLDELNSNPSHAYNLDDVISPREELSNFIDEFVEYITDNIYEIFPKSNDASLADAILELFRKRSDIDIFNKKALYLHIREIGDFTSPKITKISNKLSNIFEKNYIFFLTEGYTEFEN